VYAPNGEEACIRGKDIKAYVIDRKIFDRKLVEKALLNGVDILMKTRFIGLDNGTISVMSNGRKKNLRENNHRSRWHTELCR